MIYSFIKSNKKGVYSVDSKAYNGFGNCDCPDFVMRKERKMIDAMFSGEQPNDNCACKHIKSYWELKNEH